MTRRAIDLIERCSQGDAWAWRDLVAHFRPPILRVLARASLTGTAAEICDLEQEVWTRVLQREAIRRLQGRDEAAIKGFLCTVALNVARDARRRAGVRPILGSSSWGTGDGVLDDPDGDPELRAADRERQRMALDAAREEVRDERDFLIFQLYYRNGASASEIAAVPGVGLSAKGVETVIHRLTQRVRRRLGTDA